MLWKQCEIKGKSPPVPYKLYLMLLAFFISHAVQFSQLGCFLRSALRGTTNRQRLRQGNSLPLSLAFCLKSLPVSSYRDGRRRRPLPATQQATLKNRSTRCSPVCTQSSALPVLRVAERCEVNGPGPTRFHRILCFCGLWPCLITRCVQQPSRSSRTQHCSSRASHCSSSFPPL